MTFRLCSARAAFAVRAVGCYFFASMYFAQSALNWSMPLVVSGWLKSILRTLKGTVA